MIFQYYGIDWLAMILTFLAIWLIGDRNKSGFFIMIGGNSCWVVVGIYTHSLALIVANLLFVCLNIRAIINWSKKDAAHHLTAG
jgi:hypothetical protein